MSLHLVSVMYVVTARLSVMVGCSAFRREECVPTDWVAKERDARGASGLYNSRKGPTKWAEHGANSRSAGPKPHPTGQWARPPFDCDIGFCQ